MSRDQAHPVAPPAVGSWAALVWATVTVPPSAGVTPGQQERMKILLLDILAEPDRWSGEIIDDAHRRMKLP